MSGVQRHRVERPGARSAPPYAELFDQLPTAVLVTDDAGAITMANRRAAALLERPQPSLIGVSIETVLAPLESLRAASFDPKVDEDRYSLEIETRSGAKKLIGLQTCEFLPSSEGRLWHTVVVFQDISVLQRLREERDRLLRLATVGHVLPSILHELKNPLAAITSAVELLVEETSEERLQKDLHAILTEVRRMKLGFEGLGVVGRALRSPRHAAIDLAIRQATHVFESRARKGGIEVRCRVPDMPLLPFDPAVMRAVLFNLLTNALAACRPGGSIEVEASIDRDRNLFECSVSDTGCGMSRDVLARCTQLFFSTKTSGSGIGLALCRSVVEEASGTLAIESEEGEGTRIAMRVPIAPTEHGRVREFEGGAAGPPAPDQPGSDSRH